MTAPKIYLAGPEVFRRDAEAVGEQLKLNCAALGAEGIYPLDGEPLLDAISIRARCRQMIHEADIVVANIAPFRGHHMDPGTAWEIGYAEAIGRPVYLHSAERRSLIERIPALIDPTFRYWDESGHQVEDFDLTENLMIAAGKEIHATAGDAILEAVDDWAAEQGAARRATKGRRRLLWTWLVVMAVAAAFTLAWAGLVRADIYVLDGDTIVVDREHIRIVGLNAPETRRAQCEEERRLGYLAKARLYEMLTTACGPLSKAPARCLTLQREPHKDRYGRSLARVRVAGEDVAQVMIREGHAAPYECPGGLCPKRTGWCGR